jgi:hypothetical protein
LIALDNDTKGISDKHPNWFWVSSQERHPSKLAHEMYADALFEKISTSKDFIK